MSFTARIQRYFTDSEYRRKRFYERFGNYRTYLANPREFFWKSEATRQARDLMMNPDLLAAQAEAQARFSGTTYDKYIDFKRYFAINLRRVYRLGLDRATPCRILDMGCGCGFFDYLCARSGHTVHGLDIPGIPIFDYLIPRFGVARTEHRMEPQRPLPHFDTRFDLVVSFAICFHELENEQHWTREDWLFFLNDIQTRIIAPGGRMHLFFNDWPHGDFEQVRERILPCPYTVRQGHKVLEFQF